MIWKHDLYTAPIEQKEVSTERLYRAWIGSYARKNIVPPHYHEGIELIAGTGIHGYAVIDGKEYSLDDTAVLCIPPMVIHAFYIDPSREGSIFIVQADFNRLIKNARQLFFAAESSSPPLCRIRHDANNHVLRDLLSRLSTVRPAGVKRERQTEKDEDSFRDLSILYRIAAEITSREWSSARLSSENSRIRTIIDCIEVSFRQRLTIGIISEKCAISRFYLCKLFKSSTGMTVMAYVNRRRIHHARNLLVYGNVTVSQACLQSGFEHISYFIKVFTRLTGMTPKKWAQSMRKEN